MEDKIFITTQGQVERFDVEYFQGGIGKIDFQSFKLLGEISEKIQSGSTPSGGNFEDRGILYLKSADFDLYKIQKNQFINNNFHEKINRSKVMKGDILVASVGVTIGKIGYYSFTEEANINQNVARVRINDKRFIDKYVAIFLYSYLGQKQLIGNSTVNAQPYINNKKLSNLKIPLISLEIQKQIVEKMDRALDIKKQKEKEAKDLLESIDDFVLGELGIKYEEVEEKKIFWVNFKNLDVANFSADYYSTDIGDIGITTKKLSEIAEINPKISAIEQVEDIPFIGLPNTSNGKIDEIELRDKKNISGNRLAQVNDILFARIEPSIFNKKYIFVDDLRGYDKSYVSGEFLVIRSKGEVSQRYLYYILFRNVVFNQFAGKTTGSTGRRRLANSILENIKIPLPPLEIQEKIANEVKSRIEKAEILEREAREIYESGKREVEGIILGE